MATVTYTALTTSSQVQHHVAARPSAADEGGALGRRLDRLRAVVHRAGHEGRLAGGADAGAGGPADRHVAGLGELEEAAVGRIPRNGEIASGELDRGATAGAAGGGGGGRGGG